MRIRANFFLEFWRVALAERAGLKVDRLLVKTMAGKLPKAQILGGKAAVFANALRTTRSTLRK
jgi:hypothetical protein